MSVERDNDVVGDHGTTAPGRTGPGLSARMSSARPRKRDAWSWAEHIVLALVAYVPQLLSRPGVVVTDTKTYLYLEPETLTRQSASMWDPTQGLGTVSHQAIGYLWPMGPFFWLAHVVDIPLWAAQRLWLGTILFAAASGVLFLCRVMRLPPPGRFVAAFAFMLSPYFLQYAGRISVLLLPWAGLGWLMGLAVLAVRHKGWRYPAIFALVWLTISGTNATGAIYAGIAPLLWVLYVLVTKEHSLRQLWAAAWRTGVLAVLASLWWAEGLAVEGKYGLSILDYTEQPSHIASTSLASEVLRGLGYWYYYGYDNGGAWATTSIGYVEHVWLIATSFAVPVLALIAAVVLRWSRRGFFVLLIAVGMVLAVGAHPFGSPSAFGALLKSFMSHSTIGLALRSTDRATPLVVLGLAMLLGAGVSAAARRAPPVGTVLTVCSVALVAAANPAVWDGATVLSRYSMPSPLPKYVRQAAAALNSESKSTRVLAIPGQNTAAYTWGDTTDPVWPGILTRPFVTREQFPIGSLPSYDLLYGLDNPMQTDTLDPAAIAPLARLMSVGDVLVQNDLNYALFNQPQPQQFWDQLQPSPLGLGRATGYGSPRPNPPSLPMLTPATLAATPSSSWPDPLEVLPVSNPRPLVRGESTSSELVVDGDGVGLSDAAGLGLLDTSGAVLYAGTLDGHRELLSEALAGGATLVLTDTNRRSVFYWSRIQGNAGPTLSASTPEPSAPLDIFSTSAADSQTTAAITGVTDVSADPDSADNPAAEAIDGLSDTAWETPAGVVPTNDWWQVRLSHDVTLGSITLSQARPPDYQVEQRITKVTLTFDGAKPVTATLGPSSLTPGGQVISFPERTFRILRVSIDTTNFTGAPLSRVTEASPVGLAEVAIAGVRAQEVMAMPSDLLSGAGQASQSHRLVVVMTRERATPDTANADPEPTIARSFTLPATRTFTLSGTARLGANASDSAIDDLVGRTGQGSDVVSAYSSQRLTGSLDDTASAALDGNLSTMWSPSFGSASQKGAWIQVNLRAPISLDHLGLAVVTDGRHSVPTQLQIRACNSVPDGGTCGAGSQERTVELPPLHNSRQQDATTTVPLSFPALNGTDLTFSFTGVRMEMTKNYSSKTPIALPLGIAELGIPGVRIAAPAPNLAGTCQSDLVQLDGKPVSFEVTGSSTQALAGQGLSLVPCGPDAGGITLGPGTHAVLAAYGGTTGFNIDQLVLDSASGGAAAPAPTDGQLASPPSPRPAPDVHVISTGKTGMQLRVTGVTDPFWLVLGESLNKGWQISVDGKTVPGTSTLVDGFANGWLVDPSASGTGMLDVSVHWVPQGSVDLALVLSAGTALICLGIVLWTRRRRYPSSDFDSPVLASRPTRFAGGLSPLGAMAVASLTGLAGAMFVPTPTLAVGTFILVFVTVLFALLVPARRIVLRVLVGLFALSTLIYMVVEEATEHFPLSTWTSHFERASELTWLAVVMLGADVVVGIVRRFER